ncbi:MAG: methyltransferase domain-containing protein [Acidobacteriota bacterium]|nr:methyltransferase domain-containing protein [Acidobacteriota bacterium]
MAAVSPARKAAFNILLAVERGPSHSDDLLRGKAVSALAPADRNLATALVLGVLRWQIRLDRELHTLLARPNAKLDTEVLIALRMGVFQLLHLDRIPARAAIDESVELTKQAGHRFASGMVNAVLRKVAASPFSFLNENMPDQAAVEAHPAWMVERWTSFYGAEAARAICRHGQRQPALTVRVADASAEGELVEAGIGLEPGTLLAAARAVVSGDVTAAAAFREGRVRLQDEGSQLVAEMAGRGDAILDCCAAPGGKTLILAERNPQARIVACESSPQRLAQLRTRLAPLGARAECRLADVTALGDESAYDVVLADVPCSGTGTLGRNPEIRHRLHVEDLPRQAERQRAILAAAVRAVRPGGCVVYSTCSLEPEENEQVVAAALALADKMRVVPAEERIAALLNEGVLVAAGAERLRDCITPEGCQRLLPGVLQTDGFFIAMLEKTA